MHGHLWPRDLVAHLLSQCSVENILPITVFAIEFACSSCACLGSPGFLLQLIDMHVGLIGKSKLSVSMDAFLSLYVSAVIKWQLVQGLPGPS